MSRPDQASARPRARAAAPRRAGRHRPRRARGRWSLRPGSLRRWRRWSRGRRSSAGTPRPPGREEPIAPLAPGAELGPKVEVRVGADQPLGQRRRLDQEEPVVVAGREGPIGAGIHRRGRGDVEHGEARHRAGVVERQPVRDPATAVVAGDGEATEAEPAHHRHLVGGHRSLRSRPHGRDRGRLRRVAVAAEVGQRRR